MVTGKGYLNTQSPKINPKTHNEPKVFLGMYTSVPLCDVTAAIALNRWCAHCPGCQTIQHQHLLRNTSAHTKDYLEAWTCSVFTVHTRFHPLKETQLVYLQKTKTFYCIYVCVVSVCVCPGMCYV